VRAGRASSGAGGKLKPLSRFLGIEDLPEMERPAEAAPELRGYVRLLDGYLTYDKKRVIAPQHLDHVLRPSAALNEIIAVCQSVLDGRSAPFATDPGSLQDDARRALQNMGPETQRQLQLMMRDYLAGKLDDLVALLDGHDGVLRLLSATRALRAQVRQPPVAQAIWRDRIHEGRSVHETHGERGTPSPVTPAAGEPARTVEPGGGTHAGGERGGSGCQRRTGSSNTTRRDR
jgi:hypothetical protein